MVHDEEIAAATFGDGGRLVATITAGPLPKARLWRVETGQPVSPVVTHDGGMALAISPDGKFLVTGSGFVKGSRFEGARLWDVERGSPIAGLMDRGECVLAVAFAPDGRTVLIGEGSGDGTTARIWSVPSGKPAGPPMLHPGGIRAVAYRPDGRVVMTGGNNGAARLWDVATGRPLGPPLEHPGVVFVAAFSPDGSTLLVGTENGEARLWDVATGRPLGPSWSHPTTVFAVGFERSGEAALTSAWMVMKRRVVPRPLGGKVDGLRLWARAAAGLEPDGHGGFRSLSASALAEAKLVADRTP
jgi:WD40 repeat protein